MRFPRSSGLLLHITSLPGVWGIGDLGGGAFRFVDFLEQAGQQMWQLLPLGPPAYGNSPYSCYSGFAGNPLLISPDLLVDDGFLPPDGLDGFDSPIGSSSQVDYQVVEAAKLAVLELSFHHFQSSASLETRRAFADFCEQEASWLADFAMYTALAKKHGTLEWSKWPADIARRNPAALAAVKTELDYDIELASYIQFLFFHQWNALKSYANERNVRMFGDMPIFVAHSSADVWANQNLFWLDETGAPSVVAGVPPDYFSETGQRWGNPLYNWDELAKTDYAWWTERFRAAFNAFDLIRIDHFRGFESYWEIPASAPTAVTGRWVKGPGTSVFHAAERALGQLPIVAEDLGLITDEVHALRDELKLPGMRVLQFGYDDVTEDYHRAESYPEHSAAYTGTHDNDTVMSWYTGRNTLTTNDDPNAPKPAALPSDVPADMHWVLIGMVFDSASDTAIVPMQDVLGLGNEARMNTPGEPDGNWTWRCSVDAFSADNANRLRRITENSARLVALNVG